MNFSVNIRHMETTEPIRQYVEGKVSKLPRFYDKIQSIEVILDMEADKPVVEIVAVAKRKHTFVARHRDDDMYACVDQCLDKMTEQIRRHKDKVRHRQGPPHSETAQRSGQHPL
ncbi:MAG: ribosome-associated translation inhibitor RaiA [Planctomycetota bacterium]|nr:ribosome-associated translation inhibitor RaiA [Planctomycetota bacterium]